MKKTFIFGLMAATLVFTACSEDDLNGNNGASNSNQKGMVLRATVEQPGDTRATFTDSKEVAGAWDFAFATGDQVSVNNMDMTTDFYTFTNEGTEFKCEEAKAAESPVTWYAYFPSNEVSLVGQSGTKADVANKYALAGKSSATTGEEGLEIEMSPKVAILVINNQKGTIDINVKNSATKWVSGLTANADGFNVSTSTTKQTLLSATATGTYYIAVPAGVQLAVKDGDKTIKSTGTNGLQAGKYYNLTIFPFGQGEAKATGIGNVRWIQLWKDGPKFAEYNVGVTDGKAESYGGYYSWGGSEALSTKDANTGTEKLGSTEDTATKLWGSKWRMPTNAELSNEEGGLLYECNCTWTKNYNGTDINGLLCTGKGDYASNSIFLPAAGYYARGTLTGIGDKCYYWSSMPNTNQTSYAYRLDCTSYEQIISTAGSRTAPTTIRPVLAE